MKGQPNDRAIMLGQYIIENKSTVRAAAKKFGISKSTVHKDVSERLPKIQPQLYPEVKKVLEQNKQFGIGMNNELSAVTFGFYAAEDLTAADGSIIPADGLLEILTPDENGKATLGSDVPFGSYYVREISTDSHYMLSDEKYPVTFAYACLLYTSPSPRDCS